MEYVYVWDTVKNACERVWFVRTPDMKNDDEPANSDGALTESALDAHVRQLLSKYPEPRYIVDGGPSEEKDARAAASDLIKTADLD